MEGEGGEVNVVSAREREKFRLPFFSSGREGGRYSSVACFNISTIDHPFPFEQSTGGGGGGWHLFIKEYKPARHMQYFPGRGYGCARNKTTKHEPVPLWPGI